jgi:hypothetical protein
MAGNKPFFQRLTVAGGNPFNGMETEEQLLSANLELTVEQQSELEFLMDDPNFVYFNSFGKDGPIGKDATYDDLKLRVAAYTLDGGTVGTGAMNLKCRAIGIEKSRAIRGALTRENISPTQFVIDGARSAGMECIAQPTAVRPSISRDMSSEDANNSDDKNEWTTLQRLAAEEGFLIFERKNVLFFGSPQWLYDTQPTHIFSWGSESPYVQNRMLELPNLELSLSKNITNEISFYLPLDSSSIFLPGMTADIRGVPFVPKKMLITKVAYPLVGPGNLELTCRSPWVIEKQDTPEQAAAKAALANAANNSGGGRGSNGGVTVGPGGTGNQDFYAREIIAAAKERNLGKDGARNGIATALVESNLRMYANRAVPESLKFPHDAVGSDHDSVGLFQQRQSGWGTLAERMNARASAGMFFNRMMQFNWRGMDPGAACQKVQVSAYPGKYSQRMAEAMGYVNRLY